MNNINKVYTIGTLGFWKNYVIHMRPYLFFVSGTAGLAGMALAQDYGWDWPLAFGFLALFLSYGFGQAMTDCFQVDTDTLSAPYRPLSQGILTPKAVGVVSLVGMALVMLTLIFLNPINFYLCLFAIMGIGSYSYVKRHFWAGGPPYNGWIITMLVLMGYSAVAPVSLSAILNPQVGWLVALTFFSYGNFVLIGYLKDISADRETGYNTFPVRFGWDKTVLVGDILVLLCALSYIGLGIHTWPGIILSLAAWIVAVSGQINAHLVYQKVEKNSVFPILSTVRAFILWHLAVVVGVDSGMLIPALAYYLLFEVVMWARPMREQI